MRSRLESLTSAKEAVSVSPAERHEEFLTAAQLAGLLSVPTSWVYEKAGLGIIPSVKIGVYRRFRWSQVMEWLEELNGR
jgi:excisionase family DNA binding protein